MKKLGLKTINQLMHYAVREGIPTGDLAPGS